MKISLTILGICFALSACNMRPSEEGESGEVGRGVFYYQGINYSYDSACYDYTSTPNFPLAVATGSKFDMEFAMDLNHGYDYLRVISGSPNHITEAAGVMTIEQDGFASLFSVSGPNEIVDIVHILAMPITDVALVTSSWSGGDVEFQAIEEITVEEGEVLELRGVALDEFGRSLSGLIEYTWSMDNKDVATLGANTTDSVFTLTGDSEGTTVLNMSVAGITKQFPVSVGNEESDTDTDDDTDTDIDTDGHELEIEDSATAMPQENDEEVTQ